MIEHPPRLTQKEAEDCLDYNPFDGDFGSPGDVVFSDRICIARRSSTCNDCLSPILPREHQRRHDAKYDGQMRTYRWCALCCRAMASWWDDDGDALSKRWALRSQHENKEPTHA